MTGTDARMAETFEKQSKESKMPKTERIRIDHMPGALAGCLFGGRCCRR